MRLSQSWGRGVAVFDEANLVSCAAHAATARPLAAHPVVEQNVAQRVQQGYRYQRRSLTTANRRAGVVSGRAVAVVDADRLVWGGGGPAGEQCHGVGGG